MKKTKKFLAIDLGAESGRGVVGIIDGKKLKLEEIYRFPNRTSYILGSLQWDVLYLFEEIKKTLKIYRKEYGGGLDSIGIDSWGVDFVLLDKNGKILANPYHYRDKRTDGMMEAVFKKVSREKIFELTGVQFIQINTLYQLFSMKDSPLLKIADKFLMIADLFSYLFTGRKLQEFTLATTSQMYNPLKNCWSKELLKKLGLPCNILPEIIQSGRVIGNILPEIEKEVGLKNVPVIAVASHDTGSAVTAVPGLVEGHAYLSSGTWMLLGVELERPLINKEVLKENFTNEGGVENTFRFLKNITGLWLIQQCRKKWNIDYTVINQFAEEVEPFTAFVDPDASYFLNPVDMEEQIVRYWKKTKQNADISRESISRCIFESLALKCRFVIEKIEKLTSKKIKVLHIIGGGCKNKFLCQCISNAAEIPVVAGPVEATAIGNILIQAIAKGVISSVKEGRELVGNSFELITYEPKDTDLWDKAYSKYLKIITKNVS